MGHGHSKVSNGDVGDDKTCFKYHSSVDMSMQTSLVIPDELGSRFCLEFEKYIGLTDPGKGVYCCAVELLDGKYHLTKGWDDFFVKSGAVVGDCMVFDVRGADETVVWLFKGDGTTGACAVQKDDLGKGGGEEQAVEVVAGHSKNIGDTLNAKCYETETGGCSGASNIKSGLEGSNDDELRDLLDSWRHHFFVGANVELEDWMVEFVASGLDWETPEVKIYVGTVERSSIASNRMRLPRGYTSENVPPLLKSKNETFVLQHKYDEDTCVKFSIAKDGRAVFTKGWAAFAVASDIGPGSVLAFIFGRKNSELDIEIDVLLRRS